MDSNNFTKEYKDTYNQYVKLNDLLHRDFYFYISIYSEILAKISQGSMENFTDILPKMRGKIFQDNFCKESELENKKNNFLKVFFEVEEIRKNNIQLDILEDIVFLCQKASKIIQKHWEFYQYKKDKLSLDDIFFLFFQEVEEVLFLWDSFTDKLEVFSKVWLCNQTKILNEKIEGKVVQVFFAKHTSQTVELNSVESFITLLKKVNQLITHIQARPEINLNITAIQIQNSQVNIQILLCLNDIEAFQGIITNFHPEKLQKDGLQRILSSIFGVEKVRSIDKRMLLNYQKQLKELVGSIQKEGNFGFDFRGQQEIYVKVLSLLAKMKSTKFNKNSGERNSKKYTRDSLFSRAIVNKKMEVLPKKEYPTKNTNSKLTQDSNKEYIAYLTS